MACRNITFDCPLHHTLAGCTITWAQCLGREHDLLWYPFIAVSTLCFIVTLTFTASLIKRSGGLRPFMKPQEKLQAINLFLSSCFLASLFPDPFNYRAVYKENIYLLLRLYALIFALNSLCLAIHQWRKLTLPTPHLVRSKVAKSKFRTLFYRIRLWSLTLLLMFSTVGVLIVNTAITILYAWPWHVPSVPCRWVLLLTHYGSATLALLVVLVAYFWHVIAVIAVIFRSRKRHRRLLKYGQSHAPSESRPSTGRLEASVETGTLSGGSINSLTPDPSPPQEHAQHLPLSRQTTNIALRTVPEADGGAVVGEMDMEAMGETSTNAPNKSNARRMISGLTTTSVTISIKSNMTGTTSQAGDRSNASMSLLSSVLSKGSVYVYFVLKAVTVCCILTAMSIFSTMRTVQLLSTPMQAPANDGPPSPGKMLFEDTGIIVFLVQAIVLCMSWYARPQPHHTRRRTLSGYPYLEGINGGDNQSVNRASLSTRSLQGHLQRWVFVPASLKKLSHTTSTPSAAVV